LYPPYGSCCMSPFWPPRILRWLLGVRKVSMHLCKGNKGKGLGERLSLVWRCHSISFVGKEEKTKDLLLTCDCYHQAQVWEQAETKRKY
jgi:hypothetical protein